MKRRRSSSEGSAGPRSTADTRSRTLAPFALTVAILSLPAASVEAQRRISGTVVDSAGAPVADAQVLVAVLLDPTLRVRVETDAEGRYAFENFHPARAYRFEVTKAGYRPTTRTAETGIAGTSATSVYRQDFTLYPIGSDRVERAAELVLLAERSPGQEQYMRGVRALEAGELDRARKRFEQARKLDPDLTPVDDGLAYLYHRLGEHGPALEAVERALRVRPGEPDYLRIRYEALRGLGREEEARTTLLVLAESAFGTDTAGLLFNEGVRAVRAADLELATSMFEATLRLAPEMIEARSALAKVSIERGHYESAIVAAREVLADRPREVEMLRAVQQALSALGRSTEALEALEALAEVDRTPRTAALIYNEGVARFNAGATPEAERLFRRVLELDGTHADGLVGLIEVEVRERRYSDALATIERLRSVAPTHPAIERLESRVRAGSGS